MHKEEEAKIDFACLEIRFKIAFPSIEQLDAQWDHVSF